MLDNEFVKSVLASIPQSSSLFFDAKSDVQDNIKLHLLLAIMEKTKVLTLEELVLV